VAIHACGRRGFTAAPCDHGAFDGITLRAQYAYDWALWIFKYRRSRLAQKTFVLNSRSYRYLVHPYNHTWANERAVEIPVIRGLLQQKGHAEILEVGNVLAHYGEAPHPVVDKYERGSARIIHEDIVGYRSAARFDLAVSVSTIEHVGWDDHPRDPPRVLEAFTRLSQLLRPGGHALVTIPIGYNRFLDLCIRHGRIGWSSAHFLRRVSLENEWVESELATALKQTYGAPYPNANAVAFLRFESSATRSNGSACRWCPHRRAA